MPHEFRTIEEFVKWIELRIPPDKELGACPEGMYNGGLKDAYEAVLSVVRTSNIGIVYPKSEPVGLTQLATGLGCMIETHCFCPGSKIGPDICASCRNHKGLHKYWPEGRP